MHEADCDARPVLSACTPYSVQVGGKVWLAIEAERQIVIDHHRYLLIVVLLVTLSLSLSPARVTFTYLWYIDASSKNVGGDEDLVLSRTECLEDLISLVGVEVAMQIGDGVSCVDESLA